MAKIDKHDRTHYNNLSRYAQQIEAVYLSAVNEAAAIGALVTDFNPDRLFSFSDYPVTRKRIERLLESLRNGLQSVIVNGIQSEWTLANNKNNELCKQVFGKAFGHLTKEQEKRYLSTNETARDAFLKRKTAGLRLSDRVWNYTNQFKEEIELGLVEKEAKYDWLKEFSTHIAQLDHYAKKAVQAGREEKLYTPTNPKVITLLRTYDSMKTDERIHHSMASTHWEKFYKRFAQMRRHSKGTDEKRLHTVKIIIQACFTLMEREYVEDVNKQDCRTLCSRIYRVPKQWTEKISKRNSML